MSEFDPADLTRDDYESVHARMAPEGHVHVKLLEPPHPSQATTRGQLEVLAELDVAMAFITKAVGRTPTCMVVPAFVAEEIFESGCRAQFHGSDGKPWEPASEKPRGHIRRLREWLRTR